MEFRCLLRRGLSPQLYSVLRPLPLRQFSHTSRLSTDTSPPSTTDTSPPSTTDTSPPSTTDTSPPSTTDNDPPTPKEQSAPPTMAEILGLAMSTGAAPPRREFQNASSRFSSIIPAEFGLSNSPPLSARPIPRTGPAAGRSVPVISDLPQALSRLRGIITANNVRADQARQRFHERPGKKKRRLKSLRHRRRFKAGFKKLVTIAMEMKRKGL